jgi:hypothetical protein
VEKGVHVEKGGVHGEGSVCAYVHTHTQVVWWGLEKGVCVYVEKGDLWRRRGGGELKTIKKHKLLIAMPSLICPYLQCNA